MQKILICFFGILVIAALLLSGCSKSAVSPAASPTPTGPSAADILAKSGDALQSATAFHFDLSQVGGGTPIALGIEMTKVSGDVAKPDKLKASITGTVMGSTILVQLVTIADKTYMTNPLSGTWQLIPEQFQILAVFDPNKGIAAILKGLTTPAKLADETSGGVPCFHVKGAVPSDALSAIAGSAAAGATINVEMWVGQSDFLPRNIQLQGKITATEKDGIVRTLVISNYNQAIDIQPPI